MSMPSEPTSQVPEPTVPQGVSRRGFLGGTGVAAAGLAAGSVSLESLLVARPAAAANAASAGVDRRNAAWKCRKDAADYWRAQSVGCIRRPMTIRNSSRTSTSWRAPAAWVCGTGTSGLMRFATPPNGGTSWVWTSST